MDERCLEKIQKYVKPLTGDESLKSVKPLTGDELCKVRNRLNSEEDVLAIKYDGLTVVLVC